MGGKQPKGGHACDEDKLEHKEQAKGERSYWRIAMLDLLYIAITVVFFLLALAYVRGCEKLQ